VRAQVAVPVRERQPASNPSSHLAEAVSRRLGCARAGLAHTTWSRRVPCVATVRRRKPAAPSNEFSRPSRFLPSERRRSRRWSTPGSVRNSEGVHEGDEVALPLRGGTGVAPRVVPRSLELARIATSPAPRRSRMMSSPWWVVGRSSGGIARGDQSGLGRRRGTLDPPAVPTDPEVVRGAESQIPEVTTTATLLL